MSTDQLLSNSKDEIYVEDHPDTLSEVSVEESSQFAYRKESKRHYFYGRRLANIFHIAIALVNCVLFVVLIIRLRSSKDKAMDYTQSPAQHMIQYQSTYFDKYGHLGGNPFSQKPGAKLDAAWHNLLAGMNIRISEKWLEPFGAESVRLADGSGVIAQLGVYHELHCLKKLKRWNYRAHYYSNISAPDLAEEETHIEHCLEWLRVAALCRSDTTLTTFQWGGRDGGSLETEYPIPRKCVNAEKILEWSQEHAVDISQKGLLEKNKT